VEKDYAALEVGEDSTAIFVHGEEQLSVGTEREAGDVSAVCEGEGMCFRTVDRLNQSIM
jgi:hypothetical protein